MKRGKVGGLEEKVLFFALKTLMVMFFFSFCSQVK